MNNIYTYPNYIFFNNNLFYLNLIKYKKILVIHSNTFEKKEFNNFFLKNKINYFKINQFTSLENEINTNKLFNNKYDLILGVGGGKVIDFSKIVFAKISNYKEINLQKKIISFQKNEKIKLAIMVTMPGSGAELSKTSVLNFSDEKKFYISRNFIPKYLCYNIKLISLLSKRKVILRVLDSIMHGFESKESIMSSEFSDYISKNVINEGLSILDEIIKLKVKTIGPSLAKKISFISMNGGLAQSECGSGLCHALAHAMETNIGISHAESILLCSFIKIQYQKKINRGDSYKIYERYIKAIYKNNLKIVDKKKYNSILSKIDFNIILESAKKDACWKIGKNKIETNILNKILKKTLERKIWSI